MEWLVLIFLLLILCAALDSAAKKKRIKAAYTFKKPNISGDAHFSKDKDCDAGRMFTGKGIRLAYSKTSGRVMRYSHDSHLVTVGPTGSGKARDLLIPAILDLDRKVLVANDPKGQLLAVTYKRRLRVGPVLALNPFHILMKETPGVRHVRYNPMATLRADSNMLGMQCDKIADGLVMEDGNAKSIFWDDGAKELLSGMMMALVCHGKADQKNLVTLCEILCGDVYGFCREVVRKTNNRYIGARLGSFAGKDADENRTIQDIVQTARVHTKFIRNEVLGPSLCGSDFTFKELRARPCSFFLVLPLDASSDVCDRYYRLILASALAEMLTADNLGSTSVLFVLDEAGQLGRLKALEQAIGMARGFGVQFWSVFTDLPQMDRIYRQGFRSFLANCGCLIFLPPNDTMTADELSKLSGQTEVISQSRSIIIDPQTGEPRVTDSAAQHGRPLMLPHEVRELGKREALIFCEGVKGVIRANRRPYYETHRGKYQPDPYERGKHNGFFKALFGR